MIVRTNKAHDCPYASSHLAGLGIHAWFGLIVAVACCPGCKPAATVSAGDQSAATPVTVAVPIERQIQNYEEFTGTIAAKNTVEIRSRVTGFLEQIDFEDGKEVKEGAKLFRIDARPYQAQLDKALSDVGLNEAKLKLAQADNARAKSIADKNAGAISRQDLDKYESAEAEAAASVAAAKANVEAYRLDVEFTKITSPIAGRMSDRRVDVGNLVKADLTLLTTVVSVDPMYVKFNVDERRLLRILQEIREGKVKSHDEVELPVEVQLDNETDFLHRGTMDFADNQIDKSTGTILIRGVMPNPKPPRGDRPLLPGMFAKVRVPLGEKRPCMLIAEQALGDDQGRKYVLVVDDKQQVQYRSVRTGKTENGLRVVEEGLQPGERIIVAGLQRVRPGVTVAATAVEMSTFESSLELTASPAVITKPESATTEKK